MVELPLRRQLPDQDDAPLGLPDQHLAPDALDTVATALEPATAGARLVHDRGAIGVADVMRRHRPQVSIRAVKTSKARSARRR
jgi:hypothetical protein